PDSLFRNLNCPCFTRSFASLRQGYDEKTIPAVRLYVLPVDPRVRRKQYLALERSKRDLELVASDPIRVVSVLLIPLPRDCEHTVVRPELDAQVLRSDTANLCLYDDAFGGLVNIHTRLPISVWRRRVAQEPTESFVRDASHLGFHL